MQALNALFLFPQVNTSENVRFLNLVNPFCLSLSGQRTQHQGFTVWQENHHRGIKNYTIEISLCLTGQNSLGQNTPWTQSDASHDSAVIANSEYSNQDLI